jgi:hypothetical protein
MSDMPGLEPAVVTAIEDYLRSLLAHASAEQMLAAGLPRACGRRLRRTVLTVSCQPSLEAPRSERHLVFPTCVRKSVDHFQGGVYHTFASFWGGEESGRVLVIRMSV